MKSIIYISAIALIAASCSSSNNSGGMKASENKAKVQRFYDEVINAHNTAMVDSFCTSDFVDHNPDEGHSGKGTDDLKAGFNDFFTAFPDIKISPNFMIAQGDTVVAHVTITGTNSGMMGKMPATNKQMTIDGIDIIALKDGKATDRWGFFDMMKMMHEMGMMPPPGAMMDSSMTKKK